MSTDAETDTTDECTVLDVLNSDCWRHVFSYVSTEDLVRSERVSKQWRNVVIDYFQRSSKRAFNTSWYPRLNLRTLEHHLRLRGAAFTKLSINHVILQNTLYLRIPSKRLSDADMRSIFLKENCVYEYIRDYNDTVFNSDDCPNLEELEIDTHEAKRCLNSFLRCKKLKSLYLRSNFEKIVDDLIYACVRDNYELERLTLHGDHTSGQFLTNNITNFQNLKYLAFYECNFLNKACLKSIEQLPNLTTLKIDKCYLESWRIATMKILCNLTELHELSLREYPRFVHSDSSKMVFLEALAEQQYLLKHLNLSKNTLVTNDVMRLIAQTCKCLKSLDVSHCDVGDEGVAAVCTSCENLQVLDLTDLQELSAHGVSSVSRAKRLVKLKARFLPSSNVTASFAACLRACPALTELDAAGCDVTSELVVAAVAALNQYPRPLVLRLQNTDVTVTDVLPKHSLLTVITGSVYLWSRRVQH